MTFGFTVFIQSISPDGINLCQSENFALEYWGKQAVVHFKHL